MKLTEVKSSNVKAVGYAGGNLLVKFGSGAVYKYLEVPQSVYDGLIGAESKGRFLGAEVYGKYRYLRITEAELNEIK